MGSPCNVRDGRRRERRGRRGEREDEGQEEAGRGREEVPTMRCDNEGREGGGGVRLGHCEDTFIRNTTCTQQR